MQNQFTNWTKRLADNYLINSSSIQKPGLYNGKMGAIICLFQYYKISGNENYEVCARELLSQLFELNISRMPLDFENGLTGIGLGIEYLALQGFIGNEKNIILDEIDKRLFVAILKSRTLMSNNGIYGAGIYFIQRIKPFNGLDNNLLKKNKIQMATYLRDDCERLLCKNAQFVFNTPELGLEQLNSIVYFYSEMTDKKFITIDIERLLDYLYQFTENQPTQTMNINYVKVSITLLNRLSQNLTETLALEKILFIQNKLSNLISIDKIKLDLINNANDKTKWYSIVYDIEEIPAMS